MNFLCGDCKTASAYNGAVDRGQKSSEMTLTTKNIITQSLIYQKNIFSEKNGS